MESEWNKDISFEHAPENNQTLFFEHFLIIERIRKQLDTSEWNKDHIQLKKKSKPWKSRIIAQKETQVDITLKITPKFPVYPKHHSAEIDVNTQAKYKIQQKHDGEKSNRCSVWLLRKNFQIQICVSHSDEHDSGLNEQQKKKKCEIDSRI